MPWFTNLRIDGSELDEASFPMPGLKVYEVVAFKKHQAQLTTKAK